MKPEQQLHQESRVKTGATLAERLDHYSMPEPNSGCLLWLGSTDRRGYGQLRYGGKLHSAHRLSWATAHGPIPVGLGVLHKCDNPGCINPLHLFTGNQKANIADMHAKGRAKLAGLVLGRVSQPNTPRGEACGLAKLTADEVRAIRADRRGYRLIAAEYGLSNSCIKAVRARKTWRHIQ